MNLAPLPVTMAARREGARGFTMIEILVVVLIVGILASAAVPLAQLQGRRHKEAELHEALRTIRTALDAYKRASDSGQIAHQPGESGYPKQLSDLYEGVALGGVVDPSTRPRVLRLLRALPRDPFADVATPADQTWALRSYDSPPGDPQPGDDVFDVHSKSTRTALDGTRYESW